jgi:IclR family transcriptional regulator, mhp operon transcriptional activator
MPYSVVRFADKGPSKVQHCTAVANKRKPKGVQRALEVLRVLNSANGSTVGELHDLTGISRPSLYRVLDEFRTAGYVTRNDRGGFYLTHLVRALSDGFRREDKVAEIALPVLEDLQRKVLWPADLAVYSNLAMYLRETTRKHSTLVIDRVQIGLRLPLLSSAVGLAYMAWCEEVEREAILDALRKSDGPETQLAKDTRRVTELMRETRTNGYGCRIGSMPGVAVPETGAIAIPVKKERSVAACIAVTFFSKVLEAEEAAERYLPDMKQAAVRIERAL